MSDESKTGLLEVPYGFRRAHGVEGEMARQLLKACGLPVVSARTPEREAAAENLSAFVRHMWKYVDPHEFINGWHIDCIAEHLMAVSRGQIRKLIINVPPRHAKSITISVMWPLWDWLSVNPARQFFCVSYSDRLALDLSMKCRTLLRSPEYRRLLSVYRKGLSLNDEMDTKGKFDNSAGGYRLATTVEGAAYGLGGDIRILDDIHGSSTSESEAAREADIRWLDGPFQTRINNPSVGGTVIVMQRLHEDDATGHILAGAGRDSWTTVILPARYESERRSSSTIGVPDPRTIIGEPLWPAMWPDERLAELEEGMTPTERAAQLQQRPSPQSGGFFEVGLIKVLNQPPTGKVVKLVSYWDRAGTEGGGAFTAGCLVAKIDSGLKLLSGYPRYFYWIDDMVRGQWAMARREGKIMEAATNWGKKVDYWIEREPTHTGKESSEMTATELRHLGYKAFTDHVTDSKPSRAIDFAKQVVLGNVFMNDRPWTKACLNELAMFDHGKYRDQVDCLSRAIAIAMAAKPRGGCWASDVRNLAKQGAGRV